jgi:predicted O-methyltransferase YrrM
MRSISHWTPRYVAARIRLWIGEKLRPNEPWLTHQAICLLDGLLRPKDVGIEFGAGRSTIWISRRVSKLTSVEDNFEWYRHVSRKLQVEALGNVDLLYRPRDVADADGAKAKYVCVLDTIQDQSLDFVLIDGIYRNHCAVRSVPKVKLGGLFIIDNVNWFLPGVTYAPNSRTMNDGPADPIWKDFANLTQNWRRIWTTNGVWDTLILVKS